MDRAVLTESEEALAALVHDLRQPLGTLEYSALYLQMLLGGGPAAVQRQLQVMQEQIAIAAGILSEAAAQLSHAPVQRAGTGESRDLTNSETAAVT